MTKYIEDYNVSFLGGSYDNKTEKSYTLVVIEKFNGSKVIEKKSFYFNGNIYVGDYLLDRESIESIIDKPNNSKITLTKEIKIEVKIS